MFVVVIKVSDGAGNCWLIIVVVVVDIGGVVDSDSCYCCRLMMVMRVDTDDGGIH